MMKKKMLQPGLRRQAAGLLLALSCLGGLFFDSCSTEAEGGGAIPDYDISDLYGYTYTATITASSGTTLTPSLVIFDSSHLEWNMSTSSMQAATYYYAAEEKASTPNVYTLYWYASASSLAAAQGEEDYSDALMTATLGINSPGSLSLIGMGSTVVEMSRSGEALRSYSGSGSEEADATVPQINVSGQSAAWFQESCSYTGSLSVIVAGSDYGSSGEPVFTVTKTGENTVSVTFPAVSSVMSMEAFTLEDVAVLQDGDSWYLTCGSFTATAGSVTVNGTSLTASLSGGSFTLVTVFRPGAMPLDITEVFTATTD